MNTLLCREYGVAALHPFNPDLANTFFRAGEIEAGGRGIERVLAACEQAGTPEPQIRLSARDFWFEFPFSEAYLDGLYAGEAPGRGSGRTARTGRGAAYRVVTKPDINPTNPT